MNECNIRQIQSAMKFYVFNSKQKAKSHLKIKIWSSTLIPLLSDQYDIHIVKLIGVNILTIDSFMFF
jgi:hypothetical protein